MPFFGLVITSVGFLIPTVLARRRGKKPFSLACGILTISSFLYHLTVHPLVRVLDNLVAHTVVVYGISASVWKSLHARDRLRRLGVCCLSAVPIYIYQCKSRRTHGNESCIWHMLFHVSGQTCLIIYAIFF